MRIISTKTKYGLRAMYCLARHYGEGPLLVQTIADEETIPKKFLELILLSVKAGGLVSSKPGRGGGYHLIRSPENVTIGQVVRLLEGPLAPLPCASETAYERCPECPSETRCGTQLVMRKVRNATAAILDRTSLADVCCTSFAEKQSSQPDPIRSDLLQLSAIKH
jgi:Rrf2 family protein